MASSFVIKSPIDDSVYLERQIASQAQIHLALDLAKQASDSWRQTSLAERAAICRQAIEYMLAHKQVIGEEISWQMGRPVRYTPGELDGMAERAFYMIDLAEQQLADIVIEAEPGFRRFIRQQPLGLVLTIAPWNYPYLTAVNSIIPALMAGNAVILKHSAQTLLCAERFYQAFEHAGLAPGVFQYLHLDHDQTCRLVQLDDIDFISFTGSVTGGQVIEQSVAGYFKRLALELGGKDPAYVRADASLDETVEQLVDGVFFNCGQSCCAVERIYVEQSRYNEFLEQFIEQVKQYQVGDPLQPQTTLGPLVNPRAVERVEQQIQQACSMGAQACINAAVFKLQATGKSYMTPQVLRQVDHTMDVMREESFGPVVGIMPVKDDEQALSLMNDSVYGLTASIWSSDPERVIELGDRCQVGTVYMNRCDYLDPALVWTGLKQSGRGYALSALGYQQLTQARSFYLKDGFLS